MFALFAYSGAQVLPVCAQVPIHRRKRVVTHSPKKQVVVNRVGSPGRHPPVTTFKSTCKGDCFVCRKPIATGCGNPACGHVHKGDCWMKWHTAVGKQRFSFKKKRRQPVIDLANSKSMLGPLVRVKSGGGRS